MKALKFIITVKAPKVLEHYESLKSTRIIEEFREDPEFWLERMDGTKIEVVREAKYRFLHQGEMIKSGDEFLEDDAETWTPAKGVWIGVHCSTQVMMPIRRREE